MSLLEIEFMKTNEKFIKYETEQKSEIEDDYTSVVATELDDPYTAKCGEIFVSNSGKFSFSCIFCDARYAQINDYVDHMKSEHLCEEISQKDGLFEVERCDNLNAVIKSEIVSIDDSNPMDESGEVEEDENIPPAAMDSDFMKEFKAFREKSLCETNEDVHSVTDDPVLNVQEKTSDSTYYCEICEKHYITEKGYERHKQGHLSYETDNDSLGIKSENRRTNFLNCRYCSRQFRDRSRRISHERIHTGEKPFGCEHCEKRFRTKRLLGHHVMTHLGIKPHQCPYCEAAFTHKMNLVVHIRAHKGDKRYKCEVCDKRFIRNVDLRIHMRTHTGEKPYQCEWCGNSFSTSSKLTEHRKRHTNTKPYKCEDCGKCFYSGNLLKNHSVVHSNDRPFTCEICFMSFPRKRALQSHVKIHSDVKEYVCSICDKAFAQNAGLYCHMKSHGVRVTKKIPAEFDDASEGT